jgi:hypothetical protein
VTRRLFNFLKTKMTKYTPVSDKKESRKYRAKISREVLLEELAKMYLRGYTPVELSIHFKVSTGQIYSDLKMLRERWKENATELISEHKNKELERIDRIEKEAWDQWERSKLERAERISRKRSQVDKGHVFNDKGKKVPTESSSKEEETQEKRMESIGDPRLLQVINDCRKDRMRILGLGKENDDMNEKKFTFIIGGKKESVE